MKRIFAFLLLSGVVYLSSCGNGGNTPVAALPVPDSTSKGDTLTLSYTNRTGNFRSFTINDYVINSSPYFQMYASVVFNATDSLWHCKLQLVDNKSKKMGLILSATSPSQLGTYTFPNNTSTFIDYTEGDNATYEVSNIASTIDIMQATYPIRGTFNLNLRYNFVSYYANGWFKVYP